jgi:glycosyltransferase involved in cell wall biosynthesis
MLAEGRRALRESKTPARLVLAHRALLPVAWLLARDACVNGISVICHGAEAWTDRSGPRSVIENGIMRRTSVRVIAVSNFTAGALSDCCSATVLPPGLSPLWFRMLAAASRSYRSTSGSYQILTAFRLSDWRSKGLPEIMQAVTSLGRSDVRLVICGSGTPPSDLLRAVRERSFCTLRPGLGDAELARQFAEADLFVLATRTRAGRFACGEGFGLVLLEAQLAGTPVVAPAYGGCREAFIEGVTGVAPADESARTLGGLLESPEQLAQMGNRGACWAQDAFAPERYARMAMSKLL